MLNLTMQNLNKSVLFPPSLRIVSTLLLALAQFCAPFFSELTHIGLRIQDAADSPPGTSPETPAGYAFAIWFVIFTLSLIYAVVQALSSQRQNSVFQKLGPILAVIFLLNTLWMLIAQIYGDVWQLALLITMMTVLSIYAFLQLLSENSRLPLNKASFLLMPLLGLLSGWLSLAVFLNVGAVSKPYLMPTLGLSFTEYALSLLILALGLVSWMLLRTKGNLWYGGTVLWGLIAVIVANTEVPNTTLFWTASILSALVALALGIFKLRFKSQTA